MIEEAYEAARVMADADRDDLQSRDLCEELGDVLLQVVLNAQVAADHNGFKIEDVIAAIDSKMRRRHPHVFGTDEQRQQRQMESIKATWEVIKAGEKGAEGKDGYFSGITGYPSTIEAFEIGKRAAKIKFDWNSPADVLAKLLSEVEELKEEWKKGDRQALTAELGDIYFSLAQFARHMGMDPEVVALDGNRKFLERFAKVEALASQRGVRIAEADQATLESLWEEVKRFSSVKG
jgi:MazG family protein